MAASALRCECILTRGACRKRARLAHVDGRLVCSYCRRRMEHWGQDLTVKLDAEAEAELALPATERPPRKETVGRLVRRRIAEEQAGH